MPTLDRDGDVFVLDLGDNENRLHPDWIASVDALLDEVTKGDEPRALVTTASGKIWSNGLDLEYIFEHPEEYAAYGKKVHGLFARMLVLPMVTVAALQGHAFAGGAMFSLCHDVRVMRADRGYWCLPEATINLPFTTGMSTLIQARLNPPVAHEAMVTAHRYGGDEALAKAIVDHAVGLDEVRATAIAIAREHVEKAGPALETIKTRLYAPALAALSEID